MAATIVRGGKMLEIRIRKRAKTSATGAMGVAVLRDVAQPLIRVAVVRLRRLHLPARKALRIVALVRGLVAMGVLAVMRVRRKNRVRHRRLMGAHAAALRDRLMAVSHGVA